MEIKIIIFIPFSFNKLSECSPLCVECTSGSECIQCNKINNYLDPSSKLCSCNSGYYLATIDDNHYCIKCHSSCQTCNGVSSTNCLTCFYCYYLTSSNACEANTSNSLCQYLKDKELSKDYEELAVSSFEI